MSPSRVEQQVRGFMGPFVAALDALGISPNALTVLGLLLGAYEHRCTHWAKEGTPADFGHELLPDDHRLRAMAAAAAGRQILQVTAELALQECAGIVAVYLETGVIA